MKMTENERYTPELGVMVDCSRGAVLSLPALKQLIRLCSKMGYSFIGLYVEDTIEIKGEPYFGYQRGRYSAREIREADAYAADFHMELRPYIQTLAHLNQITDYADYEECVDTGDILLAGNERTLQLLDRLLETVSSCFRSRKVNIGMDEAHMVGLGKYLDQHGYCDRVSILLSHLDDVTALCRKHGLMPQMWSDMFFRLLSHGEYYQVENLQQEAGRIRVPEGLSLCYWDYYSTDEDHYRKMLQAHHLLTEDTAFAGSAWRWMGFTPYNRYSIRATDAALAACKEEKVSSIVMTMWADDGGECSVFSLLPTLFLAAARCRVCPEIPAGEETEQKMPGQLFTRTESEAFRRLTGYGLEEFLLLDAGNPFADEENARNNLSKILLYNDPLLGLFDGAADAEGMREMKAWFAAAQNKLEKVLPEEIGEEDLPKETPDTCGRPLDYLFRTQAALCGFLAQKADFGIRLRRAYKEKNSDALTAIAEKEIPELLEKLERFYRAFRSQWMKENKPFGLEVHTIRMGGARQRLEDIRDRLRSLLEGEISRIDELEQEILPPGYVFDTKELKNLEWNRYEKIVTSSRLTW